MKIKHWQGYGTVDAKKISRTVENGMVTLIVKVTGDHEWGLVRDDEYDLINWLVKRFDKNFQGHRVLYKFDCGIENGHEYCVYTFAYGE